MQGLWYHAHTYHKQNSTALCRFAFCMNTLSVEYLILACDCVKLMKRMKRGVPVASCVKFVIVTCESSRREWVCLENLYQQAAQVWPDRPSWWHQIKTYKICFCVLYTNVQVSCWVCTYVQGEQQEYSN